MGITATLDEFKLSFDIIVPETAAVIVAAGESSRMGGISKQLQPLFGLPVILRSVLAFEKCAEIKNIVVVARGEDIPELQRLFDEHGISKLTDIVPGGDSRAQSVQNGIARCVECKYVAIHDGARPLVTEKIITDTIDAASKYGAAAAAVPVKDTVKLTDENGRVQSTPDRSRLMAVQTPQTFLLDKYKQAVAAGGDEIDKFTDDCAVMEAAGFPVYLVGGDYKNIKITTPEDLIIAEALLMKEGFE